MHRLSTAITFGVTVAIYGCKATSSFSITKFSETLPQSVVYLGAADGKHFFAETSQNLNWTAARKFCSDANMHLATITSVSQATLLEKAYNIIAFDGYYWTGGRDAQTMSQMVWDYNNQTVNNDSSITENNVPGLNTCMSYFSLNSTSKDRFYFFPCTFPIGILCEILND